MERIARKKHLFRLHRFEWGLFACILALPFVVVTIATTTHEFEHKNIVSSRISAVNTGLKEVMDSTLAHSKPAGVNQKLLTALLQKDAVAAQNELAAYITDRPVSKLIIADASGMTLARQPSGPTGEFVFQTTSWGRAAAHQKSGVHIGPERDFPLAMYSSVPIMNNGEMAGAFFAGHWLDTDFAHTFRKKFLSDREHIAFYAVGTGISGTSFENPLDEHRLRVLLNDGSGTIQQQETNRISGHFKIGRTIYHIGNIIFTDADGQKVGGAFILTPAHIHIPPTVAGICGFLLLAIFILHFNRQHSTKQRFILFVFAFFVVVAAISFSVMKIRSYLYQVNLPLQTIYNSTMSFIPEAQIFNSITPQTLAIRIITGGERINAAQATINYDPAAVHIEEIRMDRSFCSPKFVLEKNIDNDHGQATIACGSLAPFSDDQAILAELVVQPRKVGPASFVFSKETQVLAYDGLGTNVLRTATNGYYQFASIPQGKPNDPLVLFSHSHPNVNRWYNSKEVHVDWTTVSRQADYSYALNQIETFTPTSINITKETSVRLTAEHDGVYYFHLAPWLGKEQGPVSHLRIQVDTTPPKKPELQASETTVRVGGTVRFRLRAHGDNLSGLQKNFYIRFNKGIWLPAAENIDVPFLQVGEQKVELRVFDNAGNFSDTSTIINVVR